MSTVEQRAVEQRARDVMGGQIIEFPRNRRHEELALEDATQAIERRSWWQWVKAKMRLR